MTAMAASTIHPANLLLGAQAGHAMLPVCDHYSGVEDRMRKSLQLQQQMTQEFGRCVFDVTLDCEDGAVVGQEREHARLVVALLKASDPANRVAARVHAVNHPAFVEDIAVIAGEASEHLSHIMVPKIESVDDVVQAEKLLDRATNVRIPLHVLIESPLAVHHAHEIAAHPRVQSISFGLMDFVSAHGGAIPAYAMGVAGQFSHPLVVRAKLEIASACHAYGKVPSHCVVTEFKDPDAMQRAACKAADELGYTRMWSIHPAQIRPILQAFAPTQVLIEQAARIVRAAADAQWGPISDNGVLHDRASYRYFWQVLERAAQTGCPVPESVREWL